MRRHRCRSGAAVHLGQREGDLSIANRRAAQNETATPQREWPFWFRSRVPDQYFDGAFLVVVLSIFFSCSSVFVDSCSVLTTLPVIASTLTSLTPDWPGTLNT